ncbi:helix-turn-helix domain-containing protein [Actinospica acidithermotolerans]|nr:helix-turn-helix domain-containing protein [Actinospica acidithermotolerans]
MVDTRDIDVTCQALSSMYGVRRFEASPARHRMRIDQQQLAPTAALHEFDCVMRLDAEAGPLGAYFFGQMLAGRMTFDRKGATRVYGPGDVFLAAQPDRGYDARLEDSRHRWAAVDQSLLHEVADAAPGSRQRAIQITGFEPTSAQAAELWRTTFAYVYDTFAAGTPTSPLLARQAARLLAATALEVFPSTAALEPTAADRRDAHPAAVRRAIRFIDDNAHLDIAVADIAAAAFVSIRALQLAFRRHLDLTPTAYLRRVRLEQAHRALTAADPATTKVAEIAARWGFVSHSRFSAHYRDVYGVTPTATLRSADPARRSSEKSLDRDV